MLTPDEVRQCRADARAGDLAARARTPPATSQRASRTTSSWRRTIRWRCSWAPSFSNGSSTVEPLHRRGAAAQGAAAAFQSLHRRRRLRRPYRQRHLQRARHAGAHPRRHVGDAVHQRADEYDGGELVIQGEFARASSQTAGRAHDPLSREHVPSGHAGHARRAARRRSSGSRAWCARTTGARCCWSWTKPSSASSARTPDNPAVVRLTGLYHNLLRDWAAT